MKKILLTFVSLLTASCGSAFASNLTTLFPRSTDKSSSNFASAVDINEKWIVIGEPDNDDNGPNIGAVQVHNAATKAFVRTLFAASPTTSERFGDALALSGSTLAVHGASGIYIFDLTTGKQTRLIPNLSSVAFHPSIGLDGHRVVAALTIFSGTLAIVFDIRTGATLGQFAQVATGAYAKVAISGQRAALGTRLNGNNTGYVGIFDADTGTAFRFLSDNSMAYNDFGSNVAMDGKRILVACTARSATLGGARSQSYVAVYDTDTGTKQTAVSGADFSILAAYIPMAEWMDIQGDQIAFSQFNGSYYSQYLYDVSDTAAFFRIEFVLSTAVAICNSSTIVGASVPGNPARITVANVYTQFFPPLTPRLRDGPQIGSLMPTVPGTRLSKIMAYTMTPSNGTHLLGTVQGPGITTANDTLLWPTGIPGSQALLRKGQLFAGATMTSIGVPLTNTAGATFAPLTLTGGALILGATKKLGYVEGGNFALGTTGNDGLLMISSIMQTANSPQSSAAANPLGATFKRLLSATVNSGNDSLVAMCQPGGTIAAIQIEGTTSAAGAFHGQLAPRVAFGGPNLLYTSKLTGAGVTPANDEALFSLDNAGTETLLARKGDNVPSTGFNYGTCLGECASAASTQWRHTLTGTGITASNNEAIIAKYTGAPAIRVQKGTQVAGMTSGIQWARFVRWWAATVVSDPSATFIHGTLKGPGITAANDGIVWQSPSGVLLREGDPAPGCTDGARIGSILAVGVNAMSDNCAVLASLTNCPAASNLALFHVRPNLYSVTSAPGLRATLVLRKGYQYQIPALPALKLTGLNFGSSATADSTGVMAKGLPSVLGATHAAMLLNWSDKSQRATSVWLE